MDTLPANAPRQVVKAADTMNARLDALDLNTVEIEEIEGPQNNRRLNRCSTAMELLLV